MTARHLEIPLRAFYALLLYASLVNFGWVFRGHWIGGADWLWPLAWIETFGAQAAAAFLRTLLPILLVAATTSALFPFSRAAKTFVFALFFLLTAANGSFGKIDHHLHGLLYASFALAFVGRGPTADARAFFRFAQGALLLPYGLSGLWKLRTYLEAVFSEGWQGLNPIVVQLNANRVQQFLAPAPTAFDDLALFSNLVWLGVIAFEIACPLALFWPRAIPLMGLGIVFFHALTAQLLDIRFHEAAMAAAILLCAAPTGSLKGPFPFRASRRESRTANSFR